MTQERFQQFLHSPDLLSAIPYEELKTLALSYPYAANLQLLLLLKSAQEKHPDEERNLATAAAYTLDRKRLLTLLIERAVVPLPSLEMEVLELRPLSVLNVRKEESPGLAAAQAFSSLPDTPATTPASKQSRTTDNEMTENKPTLLEEEALNKAQKNKPPLEHTPTEAEPSTLLQEEERFISFTQWVNHFNLPPLAPPKPTASTIPRETSSKPGETDDLAQYLAQKSISENPEIASETLARLYARQGYRDKAVEMYKRLMALYPEKSAFFASQIHTLIKNT